MKIIISPAKTLDFNSELPAAKFSEAIFLKVAERINKILKKKSPRVLSKLMNISRNLGELNWQRNQDWQLPFTSKNARQAIYAFNGEVYLGIDAYTIPMGKIDQIQSKLRIVSGQYGLLRPLDLIQAYRLEMGTKLKIGRKDNLYQFWDKKITEALNAEFEEGEALINLASSEYFKAIKPKILKAPIITPVFKDYKNGDLKTIAVFAKRARGLMVRFIIDNDIDKIEDLKLFDYGDYAFDDQMSNESTFVFTR